MKMIKLPGEFCSVILYTLMSHTVFCSFKKQKLEAGPSAPKVESDEATGSEGKQQKLFRHITWYV